MEKDSTDLLLKSTFYNKIYIFWKENGDVATEDDILGAVIIVNDYEYLINPYRISVALRNPYGFMKKSRS